MSKRPISSGFLVSCCLLLSFLLLPNSTASGQCAGQDATLTICDIDNPANQSVNLFDALEGSPVAGGAWIDPMQTGALDLTTGILNVWNIHLSGVYVFTYMVNGAGCADNQSTVTVTIGGYSGIPSPDGSACNDDESVNLFQFFVGTAPDPHLNGSWHDDDATGALIGNTLDATASGLGNFHFTYTMPAVGSCPAVSSTISLTVYRVPIPGIPAEILICNDTDFSLLTNVNLTDYLAGEDPNGQWSESGTSELSGPFDPIIDIQNIYNTFGLGTYGFTYTVYPTNPVCSIKSATIRIIIEEPLDFTGAVLTVNSDKCEDQMAGATYSASLTQGAVINPNGPYTITYQVIGAVTSTHTVNASFNNNGILTFPIAATLFPVVGDYTVKITKIVYSGNRGACVNIIDASDVLHIYPIPKINASTLTIPPVCQGSDVAVQLSGNNNLGTGTYEITYTLTGANTAGSQTVAITATDGSAAFTIPANLVANAGNTVLHINFIVNTVTGCDNTSTLTRTFTINPVITVNPTLVIGDRCQNDAVTAQLSNLGNAGNIDIAYTLSGANSGSGTVNVTPSSGNATFAIPVALLPNLGTTTLTITSITNQNSGCPVIFGLASDDFTIHVNPDAPVAQDQVFCDNQNATVANLLPNGGTIQWFDSAVAGQPLASGTPLVSGNYFVSQSNALCASERTPITVTITTVGIPSVQPGGQNFCGIDRPTIAELNAVVDSSHEVIWYDAASNGNVLDPSVLLAEGATYYGYGFDDATDCYSAQALAVTVTLTDCTENPYDFFIPDGFSPNSDGVNDVWQIPQIQFLFPDYSYEIYNRYGNLMFRGNIDRPAWDGKNSESQALLDGVASNGVYYYVIDFHKQDAPTRQGFLYLNR